MTFRVGQTSQRTPNCLAHRKAVALHVLADSIGPADQCRALGTCQLDLKDFVTVDGIPWIDVNDIEAAENVEGEGGRKKRVKTKNARRRVLIHQELIRLGLLRYVETMRNRKQVHLFPELRRTRRDGPAHASSNWFKRFRKSVGITEKQVAVYHSFRHAFIKKLLDSGVTPYLVAPIGGHEADLITGQVYWKKQDAASRSRQLMRSHWRRKCWRYCHQLKTCLSLAHAGLDQACRVD